MPAVAELGGLIAVPAMATGILLFVAVQVFAFKNQASVAPLLAATCSILIAGLIGFADDVLGWKIGLRQGHKVLLSILIALPITVINAGTSAMYVPFVGTVAFGLLYPLLIVPLAIVGASNAFNMLAGYNGLEARLGIIAVATLGFLAWVLGNGTATVVALCVAAALLGFLLFNAYPARVFPGNALTYAVGAAIAIVAILGNIEKYALIVFIPYLIEFALKARGRFRQESFARLLPDGTLAPPLRWYSLAHVVAALLRRAFGRATEKTVVFALVFAEFLCAVAAIALFFSS
jgi:UDP-N-acetylglucosamine--dolichyl-phosphate N-acetylglucosaminephosphotransferase